jgi:hypothetical protein
MPFRAISRLPLFRRRRRFHAIDAHAITPYFSMPLMFTPLLPLFFADDDAERFQRLLFHAIRCHAAIISPRHAITPFSPYFAIFAMPPFSMPLFIFTLPFSFRFATPCHPCRHAYAIAAAMPMPPRCLRATFRH